MKYYFSNHSLYFMLVNNLIKFNCHFELTDSFKNQSIPFLREAYVVGDN